MLRDSTLFVTVVYWQDMYISTGRTSYQTTFESASVFVAPCRIDPDLYRHEGDSNAEPAHFYWRNT
jgi:hypothetical protein